MLLRDWWPLVARHRLVAAQLENFTLRDALREANAELYKHRRLIIGLRDDDKATTEAFEKVVR